MKNIKDFKPGLMLQTMFTSSDHKAMYGMEDEDVGTYIYLGMDESESTISLVEPDLIVFCVETGSYDRWCFGAKIVESDTVLHDSGLVDNNKEKEF
jgi:hypothetical protein